MNNSSFMMQTSVYFKKNIRIAFKEKSYKYIIFAVIISLLVAAVVGDDMFTTYESTKSGFFSIVSAGIWIGIFNSIQSICKEHEIIKSDCRSGLNISSYVTAHMLWQMILCFIQSIIIMVICVIFVDFNDNGIFLPSILEYFITIFFMTFGADMLGIMISALVDTPTTAMTVMPFILILQLLMSGVLFELSGWAEKVSYITFSKWGMSAFGSTADLNNSKYPLKLSEVFTNVTRLETEDCYNHEVSNILKAWIWCFGITLFCYVVSILALKFKNRKA